MTDSDRACAVTHIPALECVEGSVNTGRSFATAAKVQWLFVAFLWLAALALTALVCFLWVQKDSFNKFLALIAACMAVWLLNYSFRPLFYWWTDSNGVTARGLFGRTQSVAWSEVQALETQLSLSDSRLAKLVLVTANARMEIPVRGATENLAASVLQHTGEHKKPEPREELLDLLAFWAPVPDEIPRQVEREQPTPSSLTGPTFGFMLPAALLLLVPMIVWHDHSRGLWRRAVPMIACVYGACWICAMWLLLVKRVQLSAQKVSVTDDGISVQTLKRSFTVPWSECEKAGWSAFGDFVIGRGRGKDYALIPCSRSNLWAADTVFAIVRRLRENGRIIGIPVFLRSYTPARR